MLRGRDLKKRWCSVSQEEKKRLKEKNDRQKKKKKEKTDDLSDLLNKSSGREGERKIKELLLKTDRQIELFISSRACSIQSEVK